MSTKTVTVPHQHELQEGVRCPDEEDAESDPRDPIFQGFMADLQKRSAFLRKSMFPDRK
jgi:hypothetical protein